MKATEKLAAAMAYNKSLISSYLTRACRNVKI
jgi:hypothetical protein